MKIITPVLCKVRWHRMDDWTARCYRVDISEYWPPSIVVNGMRLLLYRAHGGYWYVRWNGGRSVVKFTVMAPSRKIT